MKPTICVGGPLAGSRCKLCPPDYIAWAWDNFGAFVYVSEFPKDSPEEFLERIAYGYEQHCKAVAERNKPQYFLSKEGKEMVASGNLEFKAASLEEEITNTNKAWERAISDDAQARRELQDSYTASFLRSCRTCIIPSPFGESTPLTLSYGKCYKGYLNEAMEFVVYAGTVNGELEKSMGRISSPICIVP